MLILCLRVKDHRVRKMFKGLFSAWDEGGEDTASVASATNTKKGVETSNNSNHPSQQQQQQQQQQARPSSTNLSSNNGNTKSNNSRRQLHSLPSNLLHDDPSLMDIEDEDELADKLLVQFPTYGSHHHTPLSSINPTADWLLGGTSQIPKTSSSKQNSGGSLAHGNHAGEEKQGNDVVDDATVATETATQNAPRPGSSNSSNLNNNRNTQVNRSAVIASKDWDEEEQQLWRTSRKRV